MILRTTRRGFLASSLATGLGFGLLRAGLLRAAPASGIHVGCQTRAYGSPIRDRAKFLSVLEDLAEIGYEGFETNFHSLEHSFDNPAAMRKELEKRLPMFGLHLGVGLFDPLKIPGEQEQIQRVATAVAALGGNNIVISGRTLPARPDGSAERHALASKVRELDRAGEFCARLGVRASFHNHRHELVHDAEEIHFVLGETDPKLVSMVLDVGHVFPAAWPVTKLVEKYGSRIAAFHLRDTTGGKEVMIGTGDFDFHALGRVLRETGWQGWLIVEVNRRDDMPSRELAKKVRQHLRATMKM